MDIQMVKESVFGVLLVLNRLVNQQIKSARLRLARDDCEELVLVEKQDFLHRFAKCVEKRSCSCAVHWRMFAFVVHPGLRIPPASSGAILTPAQIPVVSTRAASPSGGERQISTRRLKQMHLVAI